MDATIIAALRRRKGLTQAELGSVIGTSQAGVSQLEGGVRPPNWRESPLLDAALALGSQAPDEEHPVYFLSSREGRGPYHAVEPFRDAHDSFAYYERRDLADLAVRICGKADLRLHVVPAWRAYLLRLPGVGKLERVDGEDDRVDQVKATMRHAADILEAVSALEAADNDDAAGHMSSSSAV